MMKEGTIGIRRFRSDDAYRLFWAVHESIVEIRQWMNWCPADYSLADSTAFIAACDEQWRTGRKYCFAIHDRKNDTLLGSVGLGQIDQLRRSANVGYWVRRGQRGLGVASTAARLAARFAFEKLHLHRLELVIAVGNRASIRVAEKVGACWEGVPRRRILVQGKPVDAEVYSLVREDMQAGPNVITQTITATGSSDG
jgi:RimJ/RimL family protein N-acetyltransferase